jgi:hypothetical protein
MPHRDHTLNRPESPGGLTSSRAGAIEYERSLIDWRLQGQGPGDVGELAGERLEGWLRNGIPTPGRACAVADSSRRLDRESAITEPG